MSSYAKCPLKYLYINKLRIRTPREEEDGFDVAQMGTLMHSCFESFAKKVQGNKTLAIESFKSIMFDVLQEEISIIFGILVDLADSSGMGKTAKKFIIDRAIYI